MINVKEREYFAYRREKQGKVKEKVSELEQEIRINRALMLLALVLVAITTVLLVSSIVYRKNGKINIVSDGYSSIESKSVSENGAASLNLNVAETNKKIEITVPDYCPVNYKAYAPIAMVYDKTDGCVLYSKNETEKCYPASTAKIMTAAVALDVTSDDFQFVAGEELSLVPENSPVANISKCYSFNRDEITDGIILKGASDISYVAAASVGRYLCETEDVSPDTAVSKFVDLMNTTAKSIGCDNTHFSNPDGYFDEANYTTAMDMMKIAIYATDHEEIVSSGSKLTASGKLASGQTYEWNNGNSLLDEESRFYSDGATGLKAGMTTNTGYCIVATANKFGHELICVVMNDETDEYRYLDAKNLFEISFSYIEEFANAETGEY